jgi:hypothetical protein
MADDFMAEVLGIDGIGIHTERLNAIAKLPAGRRKELIEELIKTDGFYALLATVFRNNEGAEVKTLIRSISASIRMAEKERSISDWIQEKKAAILRRINRRFGYHSPEIQAGADVAENEAEAQRFLIDDLRREVELEAKRLEGRIEQINVDEAKEHEAIG